MFHVNLIRGCITLKSFPKLRTDCLSVLFVSYVRTRWHFHSGTANRARRLDVGSSTWCEITRPSPSLRYSCLETGRVSPWSRNITASWFDVWWANWIASLTIVCALPPRSYYSVRYCFYLFLKVARLVLTLVSIMAANILTFFDRDSCLLRITVLRDITSSFKYHYSFLYP